MRKSGSLNPFVIRCLLIFIASIFVSKIAYSQGNTLQILDRATKVVSDKVNRGDYVECLLMAGDKFQGGYVKVITDSTITIKSLFKKRQIVSFSRLKSIRKIPKSRIYWIPLVGVLISGFGFIVSSNDDFHGDDHINIAAVGLLIVGVNGLLRVIEYNPKKLTNSYRVGVEIELKVLPKASKHNN
jgi:hypothetical protein